LNYEASAALFRRLTDLDHHSVGPELARLQHLNLNAPRGRGVRARLTSTLFRIANPILGRILRTASLSSPFQAAYEMALHEQRQHLGAEHRILAELARINARLEILEREIREKR
jgi:hypothetical protein